jgi:NTP pyrophosphatase (non-canonical NTP hydrolase)
MTFNEYQDKAMTFLNNKLSKKDVLINGVMGLCGESGEVIDIVKKHHAQGHELDKEKIIEELGDVCWYIAEIAYVLDVKLEDVFEGNINKLSKRYKNGFSKEESINRNK